MTKSIENLFIIMSAGSDLLIILIFLFKYKKVKAEQGLWAIFVYCASSLITNYIGDHVLPANYKYIFYTFFTLLEYSIFSFFLFLSIINKRFRQVIFTLSIAFIIFILTYLSFAKHPKIDSLCIGIETILIILYSFWYLYEQMKNTNNLFIYSKYEFWVIAGLLIYLAGSFFIYIFANQVDEKLIINYWFLTNVFYIIKNFFFAIAIYNYVKKVSQGQKSIYSSKNLHPFYH